MSDQQATREPESCTGRAHEHRYRRDVDGVKHGVQFHVDAGGKVEVSEQLIHQVLEQARWRRVQ